MLPFSALCILSTVVQRIFFASVLNAYTYTDHLYSSFCMMRLDGIGIDCAADCAISIPSCGCKLLQRSANIGAYHIKDFREGFYWFGRIFYAFLGFYNKNKFIGGWTRKPPKYALGVYPTDLEHGLPNKHELPKQTVSISTAIQETVSTGIYTKIPFHLEPIVVLRQW